MKHFPSKKTSRRRFLVNTSLAATGVLIVPRQLFAPNEELAIDCAPGGNNYKLAGTVVTVKSGNWSDPSTWGGKIPGQGDKPMISSGHTVNYDMELTTVEGMIINSGGTLRFDSGRSAVMQSTRNILLEGILYMRPDSPTVIHTLRFIGVNENEFVGGGMDVLETDIGLWVMGGGKLDLTGSSKTAWMRAAGTVDAGAANILLEAAPVGWRPGDEISITPTESPTVGEAYLFGFDEGAITKIAGSTITINKAVLRSHPKVNNKWTAEVINLSRNIRIEGTENGNSHIFIRSSSPQTIKYVEMRFMGPRKDKNGDGVKDKVSGRYGIHFHHSLDGSRGSIVEGSVIRDTANNAYVPHASHGVSFINNIAYKVTEPAFWWDEGDITHDTLWEHNIVALNTFLFRALDANGSPSYLNTGYELAKGDNNIARNNVAVGVQSVDSGCFDWEADNDGVWEFTGNMAHNSELGLRVWQNNTFTHVLEGFTAYHNGRGIAHGAYSNSFKYIDCTLYGNGILIQASSTDTNRVRLENINIDGAGMVDYLIRVIEGPFPSAEPIFLRNLTLKGHTKAAICNESAGFLKSIDVIDCTISAPEFYMNSLASDKEVIRVQPLNGQPFALKRADQPGDFVQAWNARRTSINAFAPKIWGNGTGLKGEYFNSIDFTNPAFTRIDTNVSFYEWSKGVNYAITSHSYSVRWTGQIQAQFSEEYTFILSSGGGHRLWIDGKLLIDSWEQHTLDAYKGLPINLEAGKKYDIKLEYFNTDANTGMGLLWTCKSLSMEFVPQSQLFAPGVVVPVILPPGEEKKIVVLGTMVNDTIRIRSTDNFSYQLFDASGRLLMRGNLVTGTNNIEVAHIQKGMLILKTNDGDSVKLMKL